MSVQAAPQTTSSLDAPAQPRAERLEARAGWIALGVLAVFALAVFWAFDALPFQDLPAHAGLIALRHRFTESPFEQRYFVLAPHIGPYSLFRFLGELLIRVVGPVGAVRALATFPVVATPAALLFARRTLFADRTATYGYVGLALSFGFMTLLGFASYLLGMAVMIGGLVLWLRLGALVDAGASTPPRAVRRAEIAVLAYAPLVFVAHGHAFLLFLLLAGVTSLFGERTLERVKRAWTLGPAVGLAAYVAWVQRGSAVPDGSAPLHNALDPRFQGAMDKLSLLVTPTLMTRTGIDIFVGVLLWVFAASAAWVTFREARRRRARGDALTAADRHRRALLAGAAVIAVIFLVLPHSVGWFGFVDGRLVPVVLALLFLSIDGEALGRSGRVVLERAVPLAAFALVTLALVASHRFQDEAVGYREVLGRVPARASLLNLPLDPNSEIFTGHPFVHYDKLVLADKDIVVSDVWFHQGTALYPTSDNPALRLPASYSESDLKFIDWPAYTLSDWDYVLIRTKKDAPAPDVPVALALEEHRGGWWLFKRVR
ncbi:MAG: hypothetical protein JNL38_14015 [Myxococcales bacterium]|jgi:hypothetical protein|nr:hypothetical protein [Myxococcales bacterium]